MQVRNPLLPHSSALHIDKAVPAAFVNAANGIAGLDAKLLIGAAGIAALNLLKIYSSTLFTETPTGTGNVSANNAAGTLALSTPANADKINTVEKPTIALSGLPRIMVFKLASFTWNGVSTSFQIGFHGAAGHGADLTMSSSGATWQFTTFGGAATNTVITAPSAGDVFVLYVSSTVCELYKNDVKLASHTTNLPTNPLSHWVELDTIAGQGAGSTVTIGFMS